MKVRKHTWLALAWALVVCVLLGHNAYLWLGKGIVPDSDIMALLPVEERDPVLQKSFQQMVDAGQQRVIVLVGAPRWEDAQRAARAYSAVLGTHPGLFAQLAPSDAAGADLLAPFHGQRAGLLAAAQEAQLRNESPQFWSEGALARLYSAFSGPKLGAFRDDPFGLFAGWAQERAQETPVRPRDGSLFVADATHQYVLLPMTLKVSAFSMPAQDQVIPLLDQARAAAVNAAPQARVIQAGVVLHAAAAGRQASREIATIGAGSMAGIILLTWLAFRSLRPIALITVSIGIGFLGAFTVCWLLFGSVHLLTLVFGASLIGVAEDYGIYYLCNRLSADRKLDSVALLRRLLPGLGLTLLAAVIGYMGLALTPFPGLRHMAVFSAVGLVFAWLTVVCWFPALVSGGTLRGGALNARYGASLAWWPRLRWNRAALGALVLFAVVAGAGIAQLGVNDDIRSLQTPPKELIDDQIKLSKLLDAPTPVQYYLVRGDSAERVLQREEALKRRLDPLIARHAIGGYQAISNWVPSAQAQAERRALVGARLMQPGGPLDLLAGALGEERAWSDQARAYWMTASAPMSVGGFLATPAAEPWRHLWLGQTGGVHASIVAVRGVSLASLPQLRVAGAGQEGVQWVDKVGDISAVLGRYRQYMGVAVVAAYGLVFLLLFPRYRGKAWRVLAPTAVASIASLALLGYTGQPLMLFHVLALMLLLGVGIDYGIFMQEGRQQREGTPWLAVGVSAVSTLLSFGLLGLSKTPALQAFGLTMLAGVTLAWMLVPVFAAAGEESTHET